MRDPARLGRPTRVGQRAPNRAAPLHNANMMGPGCIRLGPGRVAPASAGQAGGYEQSPDPGPGPPGPDSVVVLTCLFNSDGMPSPGPPRLLVASP